MEEQGEQNHQGNHKRELVAFKNKAFAQTLSAYLKQRGILSSVVSSIVEGDSSDKPQFLVLLDDPSDFPLASQIAHDFIRNPRAEKFQQATWETGGVYSEIPGMKFSLPTISTLFSIPVTSTVLVLCIVVFLSFFVGAFDTLRQFLSFQSFEQLQQNHQWWRIIGPNFLHFSFAHIAFNLLWWWILGTRLEKNLGSFWMLLLFLVASVSANTMQFLSTGPSFGGLSGVVYALFGFVWWIGWLRPSWGIQLPQAYIGFMLVWLVIGYIDILPVNMANEAHLFGLISGCFMAAVLHSISILSARKK